MGSTSNGSDGFDFDVIITEPDGDGPARLNVEYNSVDDYAAHRDALVQRGVGALAREALERERRESLSERRTRSASPGEQLSDDTFVDQRSGLVIKETFLRLHRQGAFPTKKVGKRILARWGDVRRALEGSVKERKRSIKSPTATDDLDDLRRELGLEPKDGR